MDVRRKEIGVKPLIIRFAAGVPKVFRCVSLVFLGGGLHLRGLYCPGYEPYSSFDHIQGVCMHIEKPGLSLYA